MRVKKVVFFVVLVIAVLGFGVLVADETATPTPNSVSESADADLVKVPVEVDVDVREGSLVPLLDDEMQNLSTGVTYLYSEDGKTAVAILEVSTKKLNKMKKHLKKIKKDIEAERLVILEKKYKNLNAHLGDGKPEKK